MFSFFLYQVKGIDLKFLLAFAIPQKNETAFVVKSFEKFRKNS